MSDMTTPPEELFRSEGEARPPFDVEMAIEGGDLEVALFEGDENRELGNRQWHATFEASVPSTSALDPSAFLTGERVRDLDGETARARVFGARGFVVPLTGKTDALVDALDQTADLSEFFELAKLLTSSTPEHLMTGWERLVVIDRVELAPAWRARGGVGRFLLARAISMFVSAFDTVALYPAAANLRPGSRARADADARLCSLWEAEGFDSRCGRVRYASTDTLDFEALADRHRLQVRMHAQMEGSDT